MRARWQALVEKFAGLSARERALVLIAIFAVAWQAADLLVLERQFERAAALNRAIANDHAAIRALNTEQNALTQLAGRDPDRAVRDEVARLRGQVAVMQARLRAITDEMITPQDMARFLEQLLVQEAELTMLRLETLDPEPLLAGDARPGDAARDGVALHRHGFEIEFAGGYLATLRYLQALEALPWRFFWDSVRYEVVEYPASVVRLRLFTLSLSEDWIGV